MYIEGIRGCSKRLDPSSCEAHLGQAIYLDMTSDGEPLDSISAALLYGADSDLSVTSNSAAESPNGEWTTHWRHEVYFANSFGSLYEASGVLFDSYPTGVFDSGHTQFGEAFNITGVGGEPPVSDPEPAILALLLVGVLAVAATRCLKYFGRIAHQ